MSSAKISNGVKGIEGYVFNKCSSLTSIKIPSSVESIGDETFNECSSLSCVEISNGVINIGNYAFNKCSSLTSIKIPYSITNIGYGTFNECSNLSNVEILNSVTSISYKAFSGCSSLDSIEIPNSVTSIGDSAFLSCSSLTSIKIPSSVINIGYKAFSECNNLTDVYYTGSKAEWEKITIGSNNEQLSKATIHYYNTISTDKKFNLGINTPVILENSNSISVDFEASISGNVANEEKVITWESSNPAIAEIDKNTTGLIDSVDGNRAFGWINLLTYDVGEATITGTTQDGRTASIKINVEPLLNIEKDTIKISSKTALILCSVKLKKANKEYLESYMNSLKVEINGSSLKLIGKEAKISDDGKSAELVCTLEPVANSDEINTVICSSEGGQKISIIGYLQQKKQEGYLPSKNG